MPFIKRTPSKPEPSIAFTVAIEECDRCKMPPTHHISWNTPSIGRTHRFLCETHFEQWQERQREKQRAS